jgi:hypothetical protein
MQFHHRAALVLAMACLVFAADAGVREYRGEYFYNFEFAYLTPEGSSEQWCLKGDMRKAELLGRWGTSSVVLRGELGPEGHYGNLGVCKRILVVKSVVSVSNMRGRK